MIDSPPFRCRRFSGRHEGFGEDASFFFDRAGFGTARWRPRPAARAPKAAPEGTVRHVGWALVVVGLVFCLVVLAGLAPRLLLHRNDGAAPSIGQERLHDGLKVIPK
jgi:hypothetical protein